MSILNESHPKSDAGGSDLNYCKKWPYYSDKYLVVLTNLSDANNSDTEVTYYDINIFVFDDKNKEISHFYQKDFFYDDAVFTEKIVIDTARYQLSPSVRAFGVRLYKRNQSKYNGYTGEFLSLFYFKDNVIYQVLKEFELNEYFSDWQDNCIGNIEDFSRTISIDKNQENGFNNLIVNQLLTKTTLKKTGSEDCDDVIDSKIRKKTILKYNGKEYVK